MFKFGQYADVKKASEFAKAQHKGQKYGSFDYFDYHIIGVYNLVWSALAMSPMSEEYKSHILAATLLHDVVEDTDATLDEIKLIFGEKVHDLVDRLTKRDGESKVDYLHRVSQDRDARFIKMFDSVFNSTQGFFEGAKCEYTDSVESKKCFARHSMYMERIGMMGKFGEMKKCQDFV